MKEKKIVEENFINTTEDRTKEENLAEEYTKIIESNIDFLQFDTFLLKRNNVLELTNSEVDYDIMTKVMKDIENNVDLLTALFIKLEKIGEMVSENNLKLLDKEGNDRYSVEETQNNNQIHSFNLNKNIKLIKDYKRDMFTIIDNGNEIKISRNDHKKDIRRYFKNKIINELLENINEDFYVDGEYVNKISAFNISVGQITLKKTFDRSDLFGYIALDQNKKRISKFLTEILPIFDKKLKRIDDDMEIPVFQTLSFGDAYRAGVKEETQTSVVMIKEKNTNNGDYSIKTYKGSDKDNYTIYTKDEKIKHYNENINGEEINGNKEIEKLSIKKTNSDNIKEIKKLFLNNKYISYIELGPGSDDEKILSLMKQLDTLNLKLDIPFKLKIRKLGNYGAYGLYFPSHEFVVFDINKPFSIIHEIIHHIDFSNYKTTGEYLINDKTMERFHSYNNYSGTDNPGYYSDPREVTARAGELAHTLEKSKFFIIYDYIKNIDKNKKIPENILMGDFKELNEQNYFEILKLNSNWDGLSKDLEYYIESPSEYFDIKNRSINQLGELYFQFQDVLNFDKEVKINNSQFIETRKEVEKEYDKIKIKQKMRIGINKYKVHNLEDIYLSYSQNRIQDISKDDLTYKILFSKDFEDKKNFFEEVNKGNFQKYFTDSYFNDKLKLVIKDLKNDNEIENIISFLKSDIFTFNNYGSIQIEQSEGINLVEKMLNNYSKDPFKHDIYDIIPLFKDDTVYNLINKKYLKSETINLSQEVRNKNLEIIRLRRNNEESPEDYSKRKDGLKLELEGLKKKLEILELKEKEFKKELKSKFKELITNTLNTLFEQNNITEAISIIKGNFLLKNDLLTNEEKSKLILFSLNGVLEKINNINEKPTADILNNNKELNNNFKILTSVLKLNETFPLFRSSSNIISKEDNIKIFNKIFNTMKTSKIEDSKILIEYLLKNNKETKYSFEKTLNILIEDNKMKNDFSNILETYVNKIFIENENITEKDYNTIFEYILNNKNINLISEKTLENITHKLMDIYKENKDLDKSEFPMIDNIKREIIKNSQYINKEELMNLNLCSIDSIEILKNFTEDEKREFNLKIKDKKINFIQITKEDMKEHGKDKILEYIGVLKELFELKIEKINYGEIKVVNNKIELVENSENIKISLEGKLTNYGGFSTVNIDTNKDGELIFINKSRTYKSKLSDDIKKIISNYSKSNIELLKGKTKYEFYSDDYLIKVSGKTFLKNGLLKVSNNNVELFSYHTDKNAIIDIEKEQIIFKDTDKTMDFEINSNSSFNYIIENSQLIKVFKQPSIELNLKSIFYQDLINNLTNIKLLSNLKTTEILNKIKEESESGYFNINEVLDMLLKEESTDKEIIETISDIYKITLEIDRFKDTDVLFKNLVTNLKEMNNETFEKISEISPLVSKIVQKDSILKDINLKTIFKNNGYKALAEIFKLEMSNIDYSKSSQVNFSNYFKNTFSEMTTEIKAKYYNELILKLKEVEKEKIIEIENNTNPDIYDIDDKIKQIKNITKQKIKYLSVFAFNEIKNEVYEALFNIHNIKNINEETLIKIEENKSVDIRTVVNKILNESTLRNIFKNVLSKFPDDENFKTVIKLLTDKIYYSNGNKSNHTEKDVLSLLEGNVDYKEFEEKYGVNLKNEIKDFYNNISDYNIKGYMVDKDVVIQILKDKNLYETFLNIETKRVQNQTEFKSDKVDVIITNSIIAEFIKHLNLNEIELKDIFNTSSIKKGTTIQDILIDDILNLNLTTNVEEKIIKGEIEYNETIELKNGFILNISETEMDEDGNFLKASLYFNNELIESSEGNYLFKTKEEIIEYMLENLIPEFLSKELDNENERSNIYSNEEVNKIIMIQKIIDKDLSNIEDIDFNNEEELIEYYENMENEKIVNIYVDYFIDLEEIVDLGNGYSMELSISDLDEDGNFIEGFLHKNGELAENFEGSGLFSSVEDLTLHLKETIIPRYLKEDLNKILIEEKIIEEVESFDFKITKTIEEDVDIIIFEREDGIKIKVEDEENDFEDMDIYKIISLFDKDNKEIDINKDTLLNIGYKGDIQEILNSISNNKIELNDFDFNNDFLENLGYIDGISVITKEIENIDNKKENIQSNVKIETAIIPEFMTIKEITKEIETDIKDTINTIKITIKILKDRTWKSDSEVATKGLEIQIDKLENRLSKLNNPEKIIKEYIDLKLEIIDLNKTKKVLLSSREVLEDNLKNKDNNYKVLLKELFSDLKNDIDGIQNKINKIEVKLDNYIDFSDKIDKLSKDLNK